MAMHPPERSGGWVDLRHPGGALVVRVAPDAFRNFGEERTIQLADGYLATGPETIELGEGGTACLAKLDGMEVILVRTQLRGAGGTVEAVVIDTKDRYERRNGDLSDGRTGWQVEI
jgi:hypothetical protein